MTASGTLERHGRNDRGATERARARRMWARRASFAMAVGSAASLVSGLAMVPLTIGYLGTARFGLFATMIAGAALLEPLDFGVGSALVTLIGSAHAHDDEERVAGLTTAALRLLVSVGGIVAVTVALCRNLVPWAALLGSRSFGGSAAASVVVLVVATAVGMPLGLVDRVNLGVQRGDRVGYTVAVGWILSLAFVALAASYRADVAILTGAYLAGPLLARLASAALLLWRWRPELRHRRHYDPALGRVLVRAGSLFFVLQLAVALAYTSDQFIVANVIGINAVPQYALAADLFAIVPAGAALLLRPLWPAYAEAAAAGDVDWIRSTLMRSMRYVFVGAVAASVLLVAVSSRVVRLLSHNAVCPRSGVLLAFGAWSVVLATGNAVAMALNGLAVVRMQVIVASAMALCNLALSIVLARTMGVAGVLWGSVVAYVACVGVPYARFVRSFGRVTS